MTRSQDASSKSSSLQIRAQKAGKSSGLREVTSPSSTTTSRSRQSAPAFSRSGAIAVGSHLSSFHQYELFIASLVLRVPCQAGKARGAVTGRARLLAACMAPGAKCLSEPPAFVIGGNPLLMHRSQFGRRLILRGLAEIDVVERLAGFLAPQRG